MRVLITGGTGNVAQYVIEQMEKDHELILFDRLKPGENQFDFAIKHPYVHGDLTNGEDCARAVAGCDAVIHLGAIRYNTDVPGYQERARALGRPVLPYNETMRVNTMGTYEVMRAAGQAGVKVAIIVSSNCVLGHCRGSWCPKPFPIEYLPIDEEHPHNVLDSYGLSKNFQEQIGRAFSLAYDMSVQCIRPASVYRPSDPDPRHDEAQLEFAKRFQPPTAWSHRIFNGYVDITDLARAIRMCLEAYRDLPSFDTYYINAADTFCLEDTLSFLERVRPDLRAKVKGELPGRSAYFSTAKAKKAFGWEPEYSWTRFLG